jgi:hypothetical protein
LDWQTSQPSIALIVIDHYRTQCPAGKNLRLVQVILYYSSHIHSTTPSQMSIRRWHLSQSTKDNVLPWFVLSWQALPHIFDHGHCYLELFLWSVRLLVNLFVIV